LINKVRILTDSTSDVPPEIASRLRITVVPAYVQMNGHSYRDEPLPVTAPPQSSERHSTRLDREKFYAQLPAMTMVPTTAVPPSHEFSAAYRNLSDVADEVIAIVVSSRLSGMYNVAHLAAQEVPEVNVHVVDSEQVTMGLGWIVIAAAEAAIEGKSAQEILALIEHIKPRVHVYAALDTLEYLRRSGRVSWARAKAAQILRIKPIIAVMLGEVRDVGRVRTRRRAIERLEELTRALGPLERLALLHSCAPEVEQMRDRLADLCPPEHLVTTLTTTIIGAHVGPRGLGVAAVTAS
jgi:DegV family protein with EDD domain